MEWIESAKYRCPRLLISVALVVALRAAFLEIRNMARNGVSLEQKAAWMRERQSAPVPVSARLEVFAERHYSVVEVADMWNLSQDAVRKLFQNEPGVMALGSQDSTPAKRKYTTLRIPESVLRRVHRKLTRP